MKKYGSFTMFRFISFHTIKKYTKSFRTEGEAFYWAMNNLDTSLEWKMIKLFHYMPRLDPHWWTHSKDGQYTYFEKCK